MTIHVNDSDYKALDIRPIKQPEPQSPSIALHFKIVKKLSVSDQVSLLMIHMKDQLSFATIKKQ